MVLAFAAVVAATGSALREPPATAHLVDPPPRMLELSTPASAPGLAPAPGPASTPTPAPASGRRRPAPPPAVPVRITIPAIGVRAPVIRLGLSADRTLQVPQDFADTGWWSGGARPGQPGPAVIVGHVDSKTGPAVFYRLRDLRRGDRIAVVAADGRTVTFVVQRLATYAKSGFPTAAVYGPTAGPALRLVTCGGEFDRSTGHYLSNTVVYATVAAGR
jgi:hypothetical protein